MGLRGLFAASALGRAGKSILLKIIANPDEDKGRFSDNE
jgi:hypothetical protein